MARKKNNKYDKYRTKSKQRKQQRSIGRNKKIIIIVALIAVLLMLIPKLNEKRRLEAENAKVQQMIQEEKKRSTELKEKQGKASSDEYIEKIAREKFGLYYPDEYVLEEK